ncbi:MAG: DUF2490 domain-containing protein [Vampirovibrionales bacterium]
MVVVPFNKTVTLYSLPRFKNISKYYMNGKDQRNYLNEHRLFQQVLIQHETPHTRLTHRTRLEERFIEGTSETALRARHLSRVVIPLGQKQALAKQPSASNIPRKAPPITPWAFVVYDEAFVHLNTVEKGPVAGFDQNRAFVGVNRRFNKYINAEAGYMNQIVNRRAGVSDRQNHILMLGLNFQL